MQQILPEQLYRISSGDEDAFRQMVHLFGDRLYHFAFSIVKNREDAEEIISDVFLKIWQLRQQLPESESFNFYLYRAVKHTSLNYLSKTRKKRESEIMFFLEASKSCCQSPEDIIISSENLSAIQKAINSLPTRCRQIFVLIKEDELTYQQVAELLNISPATVNVQMTIAVKKMWNTLNPEVQRSHS